MERQIQEPHVDAESPEDPGSLKEPERSDNAETGTGEKQPDNSGSNTEVSQGNEQRKTRRKKTQRKKTQRKLGKTQEEHRGRKPEGRA